ncbi:src kinase-associated phosphoprotein 2-like [Gadus chalcogrammus]|uniref:src kinase-associated phosphoprotein 2-like n=1 Tax=Gadus chalcogrammus TaxID=1042646 RepID=UPI0024C4A3EA|nr:src kinase-associated phosphoprotein 2-like [Gadus chalcogrammus]
MEYLPTLNEACRELREEDLPSLPKPPPKPAPPVPVDKSTDYPNFYQSKWDCTGDISDELSFRRGDAIYILSKEYQNFGWWVGELQGSVGIVPKDFLMQLYEV